MSSIQNNQGRNPADPQWTSVTASLAVTGDHLDAAVVQQTLGLSTSAESPDAPRTHSGPGWWSYTLDHDFSDRPDDQIAALASRVTPLLEGLDVLVDRGHHVQIAISGVVPMGTRLALSPESTSRLAALGLPVSFTTLNEDNEPERDPLDWLD
ncbi:hypothetical protein ABZ705_02075 [Streptomyces sp. NPDC006984]|uniref:hypothetical protein n=1 Tax=Streptomyces sp. NPDC006984 TaxID=3155463 RepID=UPI0033F9B482